MAVDSETTKTATTKTPKPNLQPTPIVKQQVDEFAQRVQTIRRGLHEVVVGQDEVIDQMLVCALTGSHALLVGVPGLAKTLLIKTLAAAFDWKYTRIQFTPDLMPADVTGYELLGRGEDGATGPRMVFRPGPVFANLVLADEINRAAPKTQSALLEAMAERHVTVGGKTYPLEEPFLVAATQNPIEQEGTYPLPEAQLDRFMMEIRISYPTPEQEEEIVMRTTYGEPALSESVLTRDEFLQLRRLVLAVPVAANVAKTAVGICTASRPEAPSSDSYIRDYVSWGAGPRGSQNLVLAAKARSLLLGRSAPIVDDIEAVARPILRHRIIVNHRAVGDGVSSEDVIKHLLDEVVA
ncbi:MAG: MoxR family ATPase [Pirellulales bacterium]|nr:MoxR family ATPase [Pirellulales bacterium]